MKRTIALFCLILFVLAASLSCAENVSENLISNGGFESLDASGKPVGWYDKAYRSQAGYSRLSVTDQKAHSGKYSVIIDNASINDSRFVYTAQVEPESLYHLSGYVLVESMDDVGNGANFGIEDIYAFSDCLFDTNGQWEYLEWYGETGEEQTTLTFGVRVGGYSAESVGRAYFDDISLQKVEKLPEHIVASVWYSDSSSSQQQASASTDTDEKKSTVLFLVLALVFVLAFVWARPAFESAVTMKHAGIVLGVAALFALVLRIILAVTIPGYQVDIGCFSAWSLRMASLGPADFYSPDYFCDYPPGAMLLLWPVGWLLRICQNASIDLLIVKLLPILFDFMGATVLFAFARKKTSFFTSAVLFAFCLLNPASLVNGAAWGQIDSVLTFLIAVTAIWAMEQRWHLAIPMFIIAALVKPQALLFAPIGGMMLLFCLFKANAKERKITLKKVLLGISGALIAAAVVIIPFSIHQEKPLGWLFALYGETLSSYAYATLNTANLYYLIGANWRLLDQLAPLWLSLVTAALMILSGICLLFDKFSVHFCGKHKARKLGVLFIVSGCLHLLLAFIGETYAMYGYVMMASVYLAVILCMSEERDAFSLTFYMALALLGVYVFGVKVHERYLFPALMLFLMSYVSSRDRRVLWLFVGLCATTFINTAIVLENSILFGAEHGHLNNDTNAINYTLCVVNILLCGWGMYIGLTGQKQSKPFAEDHKVNTERKISDSYLQMLLSPKDARLHLTIRDYAVLAAVTILYSCLAFTNLGSTVAPQTGWISTSADEQIVFDLGQEKEFSVLYYGGVSYNNFSISVSKDGTNWSEAIPCQMREGMCWQWHYAVKSYTDENGNVQFQSNSPRNVEWMTARYLRVNACESGLNLWEIVARDRNGENIPLSLVSHSGARQDLLDEPKSARNLIDETDTCIGEPSWFNSMYFDEIYHAREAYHNLHGEPTYEWTHPPLGKLLMAVGVAVFGMTPFGWRFAGTMIGVLMLPVLYLFALQLTKKRTVAFVSMSAFALDLMHFTQTRIATIDSFPLLFILLSYLFMVRYMQTDVFALRTEEMPKLYTAAFLRSLFPLFLSGLSMGLSIASKWTGAYSAVGLAVMFFGSIWRQWRASMISYEIESASVSHGQQKRLDNVQNHTLQRILITCAFCVLFFVVIPCVIYVVSYIPQLTPSGPFTLANVIRTQKNMLSYHSTPGLGMDHPFQSPWWQWPFILKPIWYVQDQFEPAGFASTIMCLGNPWVFYIGAFAMLGVLAAFVSKYIEAGKYGLRFKGSDGDLTLAVIVVGFLAQYLPWMLVPRSMYIYHYFASVPFIILSTAWFIGKISNQRIRYALTAVYLIGAAIFFVMFFPYASGVLTSTQWLDAMKWFSRLYY